MAYTPSGPQFVAVLRPYFVQSAVGDIIHHIAGHQYNVGFLLIDKLYVFLQVCFVDGIAKVHIAQPTIFKVFLLWRFVNIQIEFDNFRILNL
jgi:hypothetical protein